MNADFPTLRLVAPERIARRNERPRAFPTSPEIIATRQALATRARASIQTASNFLSQLSADQKRAVFLKLEHDGPLSLSGTGLKAIATDDGNFTLAIPTADDLSAYLEKVARFETGAPRAIGADSQSIPNAQQVAPLTNIWPGQARDRVSETLLSNYDALVASESIVIELEISSYLTGSRRQREEIARHFEALMGMLGNGQHGTVYEFEDIEGSRRVVLRCTGAIFKHLVEDPAWLLAASWFEARPRFQTFFEIEQNFAATGLGEFLPPADAASTVCVVDSGVSIENPFLKAVTKEELLRSWVVGQEDNPFDGHGHGSGIASLGAYYALSLADGATNQGKVWIAAARILDENNHLEERLFSTAVGDAIRHFAALGVRIFNLSVNIENRTWTQDQRRTVPHSSWVARSLDKLIRELDIVLVVSAGNVTLQAVNEFIGNELPYPRYLAHEDCALLDPAQSALCITVGSEVSTALIAGDAHAVPLAAIGAPSPITRVGPGISGEMKPELVELDGNLAFDATLGRARHLRSLQIPQASNSIAPVINWAVGTSSAAARVSHKAALILQDLIEMGIANPSATLIKAFLVNSATRAENAAQALDGLVESWPEGRGACAFSAGYGMADATRATWCDDHSVVMWYEGEIDADDIAYFQVPVPAEFVGTAGRKRLTVSVVHHPVVQPRGFGEYLGVGIKWRMFRGDVQKEAVIEAMSIDDTGDTTPGTIPDEMQFEPGITLRSKGAVQFGTYHWTQHRQEFAANHYTLALAARKRWARVVPPTKYAVVVRLADEGKGTEIYSRVQEALVALEVETGA